MKVSTKPDSYIGKSDGISWSGCIRLTRVLLYYSCSLLGETYFDTRCICYFPLGRLLVISTSSLKDRSSVSSSHSRKSFTITLTPWLGSIPRFVHIFYNPNLVLSFIPVLRRLGFFKVSLNAQLPMTFWARTKDGIVNSSQFIGIYAARLGV